MNEAQDEFGLPEPIAPPPVGKHSGVFIPGVGTVGTGPLAAIGEGLSNPFGVQTKLAAAITAGLGKVAGEGNFGDIYTREVEKGRKVHEAIHEAHPILNTAAKMGMELPAYALAPNTIGAQAGVGALGGALEAAAGSKNVGGEEGTNLHGAYETGGGALGGGLGAALGFKIFKGLGNRFGHAADEASDLAITGGTKTAMRDLDKAYGAIGGAEGMVPGERAAILRQAGAVGGVRDRGGTTEGLKQAWKSLDEQFGGLLNRADKSGVRVPLTSVEANLNDVGSQYLANDAVGPQIAKRLEQLGKVADANGTVSHGDLQQVLKELRPTVSKIYQKASNFRSPSEEAFLSTYSALRKTQDEGLEAAVGEGARSLRQYSALMHRLEELSGRAQQAMRGNDKVGLLGEIQKAKGSSEIGMGLLAAGQGHLGFGIPMVLKGALSTAKGAFGKVSAPYRANVLTSINSILQKPAMSFAESGVPGLVGGSAGETVGAALGDKFGPEPAEEFGPPEPLPPPTRVAKKKGK